MIPRPIEHYIRWFFAISYATFFTAISPAGEPPTIGPAETQTIEEPEISKYDRDHWSIMPITAPPIPQVDDFSWAKTSIDRFVLASLESEGIRPADAANRSTLVRRLYWDLIGLPPTAEQARQFVQDESPNAYDRLVDELLASPHHAQHAALAWLDLARFAETDGFEHDKIRPSAWRYRDWVIRALGNDLPYDTFIQWQIAGDELEPDNEEAQLATAFCVSGPDMPDINLIDERRHVLLNEMTSTVGSVVMALQFGCAQCHDHKYDAISQADFYRLRAFFDRSLNLKQNKSVTTLTSIQNDRPSRLMNRGDFRSPGPVVHAAYPRLLNANSDSPSDGAGQRAALAKWLTSSDHPLTARVIVNRVWQQHFGRGLVTTPSDFGVMSDEPSHPELLDHLASELIANDWSLKWLHRTIVRSQVYQLCSRPPADAANSDGVSHWQHALENDPENRLLARYPRRRLTGEAIRDGMLLVSDSLESTMGGPGFKPPLPAELLKTLLKGQWKITEDPAEHQRRSVYLFARRNLRYPFFATFDRPSADQPCACRNESTTAVQSLTLFNSQTSLDVSERLADRVLSVGPSRPEQIDELFWRLFARSPAEKERTMAIDFLRSQTVLIESQDIDYQKRHASRLAMVDLCRGLLNSNAFVYVD
ncbi:DUF1549 and DUF1553 domain-containing protein [Roseiconus lacunae]|uniref:DUF1549 and DUF1553 domain-containing protein n=1 Tax=Roseiconus lacunae TaxID=2605694 RepID=UPI001E4257FC|nr:DUF1549 and DUF1553 domain-containing protein [Roseiconus lacunae]MCD0461488.1 DUF1549 and DUF1553 domain-containing protein [Roseiconus lacunae]WRQ51169.1 DUF1549 and DUF1553 domain-containing protein [Stieleria sp. HD01]